MGGPKWDDPSATVRPEQGLLALRKSLGLFVNIRPVKVFPDLVDSSVVKPEVLDGVDIMVVRELTGGLYYGLPKGRRLTKRGWTGVDTLRYTQKEIERVLRVGFQLATVEDAHLCCGSAGSYSILQSSIAKSLRRDKLSALQSGDPNVIATANVGCQVHLAAESTVPVRHWIELVDSAMQLND